MKIAVPTRDGHIDDHFGHCAYYTIFEIEDGKIITTSRLDSPPHVLTHQRVVVASRASLLTWRLWASR